MFLDIFVLHSSSLNLGRKRKEIFVGN